MRDHSFGFWWRIRTAHKWIKISHVSTGRGPNSVLPEGSEWNENDAFFLEKIQRKIRSLRENQYSPKSRRKNSIHFYLSMCCCFRWPLFHLRSFQVRWLRQDLLISHSFPSASDECDRKEKFQSYRGIRKRQNSRHKKFGGFLRHAREHFVFDCISFYWYWMRISVRKGNMRPRSVVGVKVICDGSSRGRALAGKKRKTKREMPPVRSSRTQLRRKIRATNAWTRVSTKLFPLTANYVIVVKIRNFDFSCNEQQARRWQWTILPVHSPLFGSFFRCAHRR